MLVPYRDSSAPPEEDILETMTAIEYDKMKAFDQIRWGTSDRVTRMFAGEQCSIVLDDFLFLGNLNSAGNRKLLEKYQISN